MTCSEFIERYSGYYDDDVAPDVTAAMESHMASCEECRRYHQVFDQGRDLLQSLPEIDVSDDFLPRLKHRIYHIEDGDGLGALGASGSGATAVTALTMAILLVAAAWSPSLLDREVEVELSPIVVSQPQPRATRGGTGIRAPRVSLIPAGDAIYLGRDPDLLRASNALLYRYSPLADRAQANGSVVRAGLD